MPRNIFLKFYENGAVQIDGIFTEVDRITTSRTEFMQAMGQIYDQASLTTSDILGCQEGREG